MVRLLQRFEHLTLAEDEQLAPPRKTKPLPTGSSMFGPEYPGTKRKEVEKVWLENHVVTFSKVGRLLLRDCPGILTLPSAMQGGNWVRAAKASE